MESFPQTSRASNMVDKLVTAASVIIINRTFYKMVYAEKLRYFVNVK